MLHGSNLRRWMAGHAGRAQIAAMTSSLAPISGAGSGDPAMNELLSILPWAFGLVAAAAAVNLAR